MSSVVQQSATTDINAPITLGSAVTAGNALIAYLGVSTFGDPSVADSQLNTWQEPQGHFAHGNGTVDLLFVPSAAAGTTVITVTNPGSAAGWWRVQEVSGLDAGAFVNAQNEGAVADTATPFEPVLALTTTDTCFLAVVSCDVDNDARTCTGVAGDITNFVAMANGFAMGWATGVAAGSRTAGLAFNAGDTWAMQAYAFKEAAGGSPVTGDAAITLGGVTLSATGNPEITGAASPTLGNVTLSADGTVVGGGVTGDAAITLGNATLSATGSLTIEGDASSTLGNVTTSATGSAGWTVPVGITDITGEDGYRLKWGTTSGVYTTGTSPDLPANTASYDIGGLQAGTTYYVVCYGLVGGVEQDPSNELVFIVGQPIGDAAIPLGNVTVSADGTVTQPSGNIGDAAITLGVMTLSASGSLEVVGNATPTLSSVGLSAGGTVSQPGATVGDATPALGDVTVSAAGSLEVVGNANVTLGNVVILTEQSDTAPGARNARFMHARAWRMRQEVARKLFNIR